MDHDTFAVAAIGADQPGIVAAVASALEDAGASIEDSSMTILGGQFAMLLLVQGVADAASLEQVLAPAARDNDLLLEVRPAGPSITPAADDVDHTIAAYGPDRPGLVAALARVLADAAVNVTDFGSRVGSSGTFAMWFNVSIPASLAVDALAARLAGAGGEVQLDVSIHPVDVEEL